MFGLAARAEALAGEYDHNFLLTSDGAQHVLKVSPEGEDERLLQLQREAFRHLHGNAPRMERAAAAGSQRFVRLQHFVPGTLLAHVSHSATLLRDFGGALARMDKALLDFDHPAAHRELQWDLTRAGDLRPEIPLIADPRQRRLALGIIERVDLEVLPILGRLRQSVIHNDANDYNVVVQDGRVSGFIDFGDIVYTATVCELAIAAAYVMAGKDDPLGAAAHVVAGYDEVVPLTDAERRALFPLSLTRLAMSVIISAARKARDPGNAYYMVHESKAWQVLEQLADVPFDIAQDTLFAAQRPDATLRSWRTRHLGRNLSLSYREPLQIVRGWKQYLFDADGREYLDAYNNVPHVGHSHPRVVAAVARQMAVLNTNTRYLHDIILRYSERLTATLPAPLSVCYFVNSGSEANELALRLARAYIGSRDVIVSDGAYHGNTQTLIDVSPYKHAGPGGSGRPSWVQVVPVPDTYRNPRAVDAAQIFPTLDKPAAFLIESGLSAGGQIIPPPGYLRHAFDAVRKAGGVCIVDEVQIGFGRVGSHFWAFELGDVVPDIVVMGKPIANGHPVGAVVTTPAIASAFDNGMEYFNTFGGNPVSMAAALEVLDIVAEEQLQSNALRAGNALLDGLRQLMSRHEVIGDVRGAGLFVGVELVRDRETREPAGEEATAVVNALKERGILTGTEGPFHNVVKIKPPLVFTEANAARLVETLDDVLRLSR